MNKSHSIFVLILFITAFLQGCSEGGSSGSQTNANNTPVDSGDALPSDNDFVLASFNEVEGMKVGETKSIQLNLENLALSESKIVYFEWQNLEGGMVNDGSIRPVKGIIRPQESAATFNYEYTAKTEGTQLLSLILTSENKKEITKKIELSAEE